ncbi:four helix bundle protein [Salegentibacter salarius]|uniref:Four helix bundle protein n=1 Tax=Salegentibacter salarius TaxID=435906 RepID=A0A2N0TVR6_9FLAO|nr:four helix bundle protein [Salegentibacter salarius]OEY72574.1 four helix bundle protein [Salegentibacter salarius]PKD18833.1 four helix bundle protein [Salegentibacter salarius]SLK01741.1 four helix bundle protein [Salegentibacter salarius]
MHNFQNLKIWQKAMDIAKEVYVISSKFPSEEKYGLTSQIRRSAISIASNIAEGAGRNTNGEFKNFLGIANGSSNELCTQLILSYRLNLISEDKIQPVIDDLIEIQKMNYTLIKKFSS